MSLHADGQTGQSSRSPRELLRGRAWTLAAALVAAAHFAAFAWRDLPLVTDVRHFVYFAQRVAAGALPHVDFFEPKPPLAAAIGAGLYRLGLWLGVEPLHAIRCGYLGLAALAATLSFAAHRALAGGRVAGGAFALSFHCGFWLLGILPAIGNMPKLAMALLATASALSAHRRAWLTAGLLAGLAALDWQLGVLALLGAGMAAGLQPGSTRRRAAARLAAGAVLAAVPIVAIYGAHGALGALYRQTVVATLFRGTATRTQAGAEEWLRRWQVVASGTDGHTWLLAVALAGVPAYAMWLARPGTHGARGLAAALGVYHFGILAFSAWDFQVFGDLFALLHTACFFAAMATGELYLRLERRSAAAGRWLLPAIATVACLVITRPWISRAAVRPPGVGPDVTLAAQRRIAAELAPTFALPTAAALGATEQLFLTGTANPMPIVVWNPAVYSYYRRDPGEPRAATLVRLLAASGVVHLVCDAGHPHCAGIGTYRLARTVGHPSGYRVDVYARSSLRSPVP